MAATLLVTGGLLAAGPVAPQTADVAPTFPVVPAPSLNFYGVSGLMDMPSAESQPDAQFSNVISYFGGNGRFNLSFQAFPWLSGTFRWTSIDDLNLFGFDTYYDRSFDVRFRLLQESTYVPELTLGLQDFVGTGIYSAEYLVATKTFQTPPLGSVRPGNIKVTGGLGWGRYGSENSIGSPFGDERPTFDGGTGGELATDAWFRGPMSPFAGIEYQPNDQWSIKVEYSTDAYVLETQDSNVFERESDFNFGVEYQATPITRIGAYYMYGSEIGVSAQFQLNPYRPVTALRNPAPTTVAVRPSRSANPGAWSTSWASSASAPVTLSERLAPILAAEGLVLESLTVSARSAEVRFQNNRYQSTATAIGRVARAMTRTMPASVETFTIVPESEGLALSAVTIRRSDLEAEEFGPQADTTLASLVGYGEAPRASANAVVPPGLYPNYAWSVVPYFTPSYFDPSVPIRLDVGVELNGTVRPAPGWILSGALRQRIFGNIADGPPSNSVLPRVRTDAPLYAEDAFSLNRLYGAKQWRPGTDLYARVTAGYLEEMFGGISTELLWKPVTSRLGLGLEVNYAVQRETDDVLGFQDYDVLTGHASAYYEFGDGYIAQVDVGRYLAGDYGATFSLDRTFDNGWSVGAFFSQTDVSAEDFGEGSFDKGIRFNIPISWFLGIPSQNSIGTTIRPTQRDGGQKLNVPGRLYGQVREAHSLSLRGQASGFWE
jgi:hypothetical protein